MIKNMLVFIVVIGMIACKTNSTTVDYFGQAEPQATPVIFGECIISQKGRFEHGISFTPDARELAFGILNNDDSGVIYYSQKGKDSWTQPMPFGPLKNESAFLPNFTPDAKSLLYTKSKSGTNNLYVTDIWNIEKVNGSWSLPGKIQAPISSISREANASMTNDGTIYFSSNRNCLGKEGCYSADLFYSNQLEDGYQIVQDIPELHSSNDQESIFISPEETYILFCEYTDNETGMDLYISYQDYANKWTSPQILNSKINSKDWDRRPFISIDNKFLFFTRLQIDKKGVTESDIYWVTTSKIFMPFVYKSVSDITLRVGEQFELSIPIEYFKDIDDDQLAISINQSKFDWLEFDSKKMKLSGLPTMAGDFELTFTAVDKFSNTTEDKIKISVSN